MAGARVVAGACCGSRLSGPCVRLLAAGRVFGGLVWARVPQINMIEAFEASQKRAA
jgi:hypothetical protein